MRHTWRAWWVLSVLAWICWASPSAQADISFGVNAPRGKAEAQENWTELATYLSSTVRQPVSLVPLQVADLVAMVQKEQIDFVLANPVQAVALQEQFGAQTVATLQTHQGSKFAGVIIAKKGSGITKGTDLRGKKVWSLRKSSAGAYMFQAYHLHQQGIQVPQDFGAFQETPKQDDLVMAVHKGFIDAAFVRTGILESMAKEGSIKLEDFVIVDQRNDKDFQFLHSTQLYPEWYVMAHRRTDGNLVKQLKTALLQLKPETKAAQAAEIQGFIEPLPLDNLKKAMQVLKAGPYSQ